MKKIRLFRLKDIASKTIFRQKTGGRITNKMLFGRLHDLNMKLVKLEADVTSLARRVEKLENRMASSPSTVDIVGGQTDNLEGRMDNLGGRMDQLAGEIGHVNIKLESLKHQGDKQLENVSLLTHRISAFLGCSKDNDLARVVENLSYKYLKCIYPNRNILRLYVLPARAGEHEIDEEIDLFSEPEEAGQKFILAEATVSLISKTKVMKCVRKKIALSERKNVPLENIDAYLFTLIVGDDPEISNLLAHYNIILKTPSNIDETSFKIG